ncbi:serine/threonine-protein phosphatase 7 long form homolog [Gossypium raimondii]|uniref:serine/threonine-protein phosphatase 7 long form homolog n=1 Tax=Gossypium raimondii TaxID=29730 RepID=UPI00063B01CA|nr:serine/threonine-protein phosphatase 7 long form homolog [Gossypium raimondii]
MSRPPSPLIENYLREAGFSHVATIGWGCKLDPKLISTLIERWRFETHTFHLPCRECTITLEDVQLQLRLSMDKSALIGSVQSVDWGPVCYDLLGAIPDNNYGDQIEMSWLRDTFSEPGNDSTEVERIRYAQAYILDMTGGYLIPDLSRNLVHLRWLLKLIDFRAVGEFNWGSAVLATLNWDMCGATPPTKAKIRASYVGIPIALEDIRLLLDQRSEAQVPLVNYATVEIHQTDKVLRQFRFRQPISVVPKVLNDEHKSNTNWLIFWSKYIEM